MSKDLIHLYSSRLEGKDIDWPLSDLIPHDDFYSYSVAYQILLSAGVKSETGAYFTPKFIVHEVIDATISEKKKFLEPCCGVGFFVIEYIKK